MALNSPKLKSSTLKDFSAWLDFQQGPFMILTEYLHEKPVKSEWKVSLKDKGKANKRNV